MQEFIYQAATHDLTNSENYNLSIQVSLDGFSFLLLDASAHSVSFLYHTPLTLSVVSGLVRKSAELLGRMQLPGKKFNQVTVITDNHHVKLIPSILLTGKNLKSFFTFGPKESNHYEFISTPFDKDYNSVFVWYPDLMELFSTEFPGSIFVNESVPLINHFRNMLDVDSTDVVHCHFHAGYFLMFALKGMRIEFFNTFSHKTPEDVLYYVTAFLQHIENYTPVIRLSGLVSENGPEAALLGKYYPVVEILRFKTDHLSLTGSRPLKPHVIAPLLSYNGL